MADKCVTAETRLAGLISKKAVFVDERDDSVWLPRNGDFWAYTFPKWARDNAAAFSLMVEHDIDVQHDGKDTVCTNWAGAVQGHAHDVADHPSKNAAVRYAIVQAVITKLEAGINPKS